MAMHLFLPEGRRASETNCGKSTISIVNTGNSSGIAAFIATTTDSDCDSSVHPRRAARTALAPYVGPL